MKNAELAGAAMQGEQREFHHRMLRKWLGLAEGYWFLSEVTMSGSRSLGSVRAASGTGASIVQTSPSLPNVRLMIAPGRTLSINSVPNPVWEGSFTRGPPVSRHVKLRIC